MKTLCNLEKERLANKLTEYEGESLINDKIWHPNLKSLTEIELTARTTIAS